VRGWTVLPIATPTPSPLPKSYFAAVVPGSRIAQRIAKTQTSCLMGALRSEILNTMISIPSGIGQTSTKSSHSRRVMIAIAR
jgi:hypothetical protein